LVSAVPLRIRQYRETAIVPSRLFDSGSAPPFAILGTVIDDEVVARVAADLVFRREIPEAAFVADGLIRAIRGERGLSRRPPVTTKRVPAPIV
jgi:hypothetical protein